MSKLNLFAKLSTFQYLSEIVMIGSALIYSFLAANFLGPEKYGFISYLMAFVVGIPLLCGFETFSDLLKVYLARYRSKSFFKKTLFLSAVCLIVLLIISLVFAEEIANFAGKGNGEIISYISILIFVAPFLMIVQAAFAGFKQFGKLLKLIVFQKILDIVFLLLFLFVFNAGYLALFYSAICSLIIVIIVGLFWLWRSNFTNKPVPKKEITSFTIQSGISNILKGGSSQAEIWIFGSLLPLYDFGIFYLVRRITTYVYDTPQVAISEVILPFLSEVKKKETLVAYTSQVMKFQFLLSIFLSIMLVTVIPLVLMFFFPAYFQGAIILPLIAVCFVFNFASPLVRLLRVINKNWIISAGFLIYILTTLVFGWTLIPAYGLFGAAAVLCINRMVYSFFIYGACRKQGYKVSIIPRRADIVFFYQQIVILVKRILSGAKHRFHR